MFTRRSIVTTYGALLGLALGVATLTATSGTIEYLTFSGPVSLPGVSLGSGSYSFQILDLQGSASVVSVRNSVTHQPVFLGMTTRIDRPASSGSNQSVVFGESTRGVATPIVAWYPAGAVSGHQFIYPRR
jgi:hypothetical protein